MKDIILQIKQFSDYLAANNDLDLEIFFVVYLLSILPFYAGYLLMFYGTTRKLKFDDLIHLRFKGKFQWNEHSKIGLIVHLVGRVMPYAYIIIFGKNLQWWVYIVVVAIIVVSILFFIKKIYIYSKGSLNHTDISIVKKEYITDSSEAEKLWEIYDTTFEPVNKISPCKQSFDHEHFVEVLQELSVQKYLLYKKDVGVIGLALTTNDFKNTPWISEEYFRVNYPSEHAKKSIYYFMGIAISKKFRGNKHSIYLIEHIIDDLPQDIVLGFDHSRNINPMLHHFTRVVRQSHLIERRHIDRQHYHVVQRKK